ncbi:glycosyltransferase [Vreelandella salicampi]|uniref:Glycosyltransferase n=1 Tax=Vreelandella salicampi TaxID=1449798 RepID=A0A7Z0RUM0_9GAMM|nr:glycosyltransferase [Halomonas salicampi]NYS60325.1 glycosyltransferase [Halomonas salicampi]
MDELLHLATQLADQPAAPIAQPIEGRVAYVVSHGQSYASNGYAIRTQGIAQALNQHGFETLCFVRPGRPWELVGVKSDITPEVTVNSVRYIHSRWKNGQAPNGERAQLEANVARFIELFQVYRPAVVLAASNWMVGLPAWIAAKRLGLPFYNEVRGFWELSRDAREPGYANTPAFKQEAERDAFVAKQARKVFTLNQPMLDELVNRGIDANRIEIVPNGVSELPKNKPADPTLKQQLGIQENEKVIGYVGSFSAYEGLDVLLEACTQLVQKGEKLKLLLVGDDQLITEVTTGNKTFTNQPWLIQVGRVPHAHVADYYALIDAVVIPRKKLPVCELVPPMKAAEALAYGKRLVVSDVVPLVEYAQQHNGVVSFEAGKVGSLAQALQKALKLPASKISTELLFSARTELIVKVLNGEESGLSTTEQVKTNPSRQEVALELLLKHIEPITLQPKEPTWLNFDVTEERYISISAEVEYRNIREGQNRKAVLLLQGKDASGNRIDQPLGKLSKSEHFSSYFIYLVPTRGKVLKQHKFVVPADITQISLGLCTFNHQSGEEIIVRNIKVQAIPPTQVAVSEKALIKKKSKALIFTNLGLSTIDGSSVFIANIANIYSQVFEEVYLLSVQKTGDNFKSRIKNQKNLNLLFCDSESVREEIYRLDQELDFDTIFVRGWGQRNIWFDKRYASKICYYCPLTKNPSEEDLAIFRSVGELAFQTEELRNKTIKLIGDKKNILIPPLINFPKNKKIIKKRNKKVVVSYIGTLRSECYSYNLLSSLINMLHKFNFNIEVNIAIGKIFYEDAKERSEVVSLVDKLRSICCVSVEEKVSQERCDEILESSDLSFSLWEPNEQNSTQVSTKMLDCLSSGCNVICFRTDLHEKILGKDYQFFIESIEDLDKKIFHSVKRLSVHKTRYKNNYLLSNFSLEWHVLNIARNYGVDIPNKRGWEKSFFSNQYDNIYGIYINESEKRKLEFLSKNNGLKINYFKGVDGRIELKDEFEHYSKQPFATNWERRAKRKRLTIGAMGHLASFISVAKDALKNGYKKILIFEADILLHKDFFSLYFQRHPKDFKIFYLGAGKWNSDVNYISSGFYYRPNQTTGTFAVAFDAVALELLLEEWSKLVDPSDIAMWPVTDKFNDECYVSVPNLAICDVATSLTGSGRSQREISEKFGWDLFEYNIHYVERVNKYFHRIFIEFDHVLTNAFIKISCQHKKIEIPVHESSYCILVEDVVEEIECFNLFIKNINEIN